MAQKEKEIAFLNMENLDDKERTAERRRILKNVVLISFGFLLNFTAYMGLSKLQSSLHVDEGMGVINQAVMYGTLVLSCLFVPKIVLRTFGHKWTIPLMFMGYTLWLAANGYGVWWTMTPASIIVGLFAAPLWTAQCSYFTVEAERYAILSQETENDAMTKFFGIFFCFFQMSSVTGSVISSTILEPAVLNDSDVILTDETLQFCGPNDCPGNNVTNPNLEDPDSTLVWIMVGIYIGIAILGILTLMIFVDQLPSYVQQETKKGKLKDEISHLLLSTFKHLRHQNQLLLIPLTIFSGLEQGFVGAEFNKSYVTCSIGIWSVGLVSIPYGLVNAFVSFIIGYLVKYTGRIPIFLTGFVFHQGVLVFLLTWIPSPDESYLLYILSAVWGFSDAIWQTLLNAFYGSLFRKESDAAFSNYRMWESIGFIAAFGYSTLLCTSVKLYVLISVLLVGMVGYGVVEYSIYKPKKTNNETEHKISNKATSGSVTKVGTENKAFSSDIHL